jgi:protein tyrosine phosphatase
MNSQEKELRRKKVLDMHNSGASIQDITDATGLSRSGIYKILDIVIKKGEIAPKEPVKEVKLTGQEERFTSFVGYERTNVNQYAHKDTGEIVNVAFVKAKNPGEFGYFVKVKSDSEKSTASGNQ